MELFSYDMRLEQCIGIRISRHEGRSGSLGSSEPGRGRLKMSMILDPLLYAGNVSFCWSRIDCNTRDEKEWRKERSLLLFLTANFYVELSYCTRVPPHMHRSNEDEAWRLDFARWLFVTFSCKSEALFFCYAIAFVDWRYAELRPNEWSGDRFEMVTHYTRVSHCNGIGGQAQRATISFVTGHETMSPIPQGHRSRILIHRVHSRTSFQLRVRKFLQNLSIVPHLSSLSS